MRMMWLAVCLAALGCNKKESGPEEKLVVEGPEGKVSVGPGGVTITGKEGKVVAKTEGERLVVEGPEGKAVIEQKDDGKAMVITGPDGKKVTVSGLDDESGMVMEGDDGKVTMGSKKVPEGFPLSILENAEIQSSMSSEIPGKGQTFVVVYTTPTSVDTAAGFYDKALREKGFTVQRHDINGPQGTMVSLGAKSAKANAAVTVVRKDDEDRTSITVHWNPK